MAPAATGISAYVAATQTRTGTDAVTRRMAK